MFQAAILNTVHSVGARTVHPCITRANSAVYLMQGEHFTLKKPHDYAWMQNCSWTHPRGAFDSALFANNKSESVFPHSFSVLFSAALRDIKTDAFRDSQRQREREKKPNPQGCVKSSMRPGRDIFRCEPVLPHDFPGVLIVTIPESLWHTCHRLCRSLICVATDRGWICKEPK